MGKLLYSKYILFVTVSFLLAHSIIAQDSLKFKGRLLIDMQIIEGASVTVFDGKQIVCTTKTNGVGNFLVKLAYGKVYVVQFKKSGFPIQKIILNAFRKSRKDKERVTLTLSSKRASKEGYSKDDAVATYTIKESGFVVKKIKRNVSESTQIPIDKEKIQKQRIALEQSLADEIKKLPEKEQKKYMADYKILQRKKDSILLLARQEAGIVLHDADTKAKKAANRLKNDKNPIISIQGGIDSKINTELQKFAIPEQKFLSKKKVKGYRKVITKYSKKKKLTPQDSIEYLKNIMLFNEEVIKSAWLQLEVDKLNAKTKEDSIALQKRENEIRIAEAKIAKAKDKIALQNAEIKYKNIVILFEIIAIVLLVIFFVLLYFNFRNKKKSNLILAKKNKEIANKNTKILDSIRYAQTIQQAILPIKNIVDKHFEWFVVFLPKDIVSGDFYWFHHFDDLNMSVIAVVDCTGHGVPGAFMSLIGNRLLMEAVKEKKITNPIEILEKIDEGIKIALMQDQTSNNDGMDVCICTIEKLNKSERRICFAGAKRPLFYTDRSSKDIQYIKGTVRGIGGRKRLRNKQKKEFTEYELLLDKGETLYLTTDGVFDLHSPEHKKFGRLKFIDLLNTNKHKSLEEQQLEIMEAINLHKETEPQIDDITILGIKL